MSVTAALWLAAESVPTFRVLRRPAHEIGELARARLRGLLAASTTTEFGRARLREAGIDPDSHLFDSDPYGLLHALRPVGKAEIRDSGVGALAGNKVDPRWYSSRSSGTTGEPFRVYYDPRSWVVLKHLVKLRARAACGLRPYHRVALLDAIPPYETRQTALERTGRVRRISVLQPAEAVAAELADFAPDAIYGLPSALIEAARVMRASGSAVAPRWVFTSGELLDPAARRALLNGYACPVLDVYGTSETKEIAWECPAGGRHINADVVHVEILDPDGAPVPLGEEGEIVVTLLVNSAMPLVRYRTGDRGSHLPGTCQCGLALPRLGVVTGRESHMLELDGGRRVSPYALTCALEAVPDVLRYQVSQLGAAQLRVRAHAAGRADHDTVAAGIRQSLHAALQPAGDLRVDVEFVERFEIGVRAKFQVVVPHPFVSLEKE